MYILSRITSSQTYLCFSLVNNYLQVMLDDILVKSYLILEEKL